MNNYRRLLTGMLHCCLASSVFFATHASGQAYPNRPIKIVVPFGSGAAADVAARRVAVSMSNILGQPIIVENRPGAGGSIGADYAAKAAPDGYTLLAGTINTHAFNPGLYKSLPYDPIQSFEPISRFVSFSNVLVVPNSLGVSSIQQLIDAAARSDKPLTFSSLGTGQSGHLAGELLASGIGKPLLHVPYKDVGQYIPDLIDGRVDLTFANIPTVLSFINTGKIKALAISSQKRSALLPNVPTFSEAGLKGQDMNLWIGLFAPKGTPPDIVAQLNRVTRKALESPDVKKGADEDGSSIEMDATPAAFRTFVESEVTRWKGVMKAAGITPQ